jgi:hypothetical protein
LIDSELPVLAILGPKNVIVGAVFKHPERREVDEIGDLNPHRPVLTTQKEAESSVFIGHKNIPSGNNLLSPNCSAVPHTGETMKCSDDLLNSPWEACLLRQPHSEPRAFIVTLADELPLVIPVAHDPSHLVLEHLPIRSNHQLK